MTHGNRWNGWDRRQRQHHPDARAGDLPRELVAAFVYLPVLVFATVAFVLVLLARGLERSVSSAHQALASLIPRQAPPERRSRLTTGPQARSSEPDPLSDVEVQALLNQPVQSLESQLTSSGDADRSSERVRQVARTLRSVAPVVLVVLLAAVGKIELS